MPHLKSACWRACRILEPSEFWRRWDALRDGAPTPFQDGAWMRDWYATLGAQPGLEPVLVRLADGDDDAMLLPLVMRQRRGRRELLPADLGVIDYNAPLLRSGAIRSDAAARSAWAALRPLLAQHGDLLRLPKLLAMLHHQPNPLAVALDVRPSELHGHAFATPLGWPAWRQTLSRQVRRESERHWRVFTRHPEARFRIAADLAEGCAMLDRLQIMQDRRMVGNPDYRLDQEPYRAFYRRGLQQGLAEGRVVMSGLIVADTVIAAAYGLRQGDRFVMVRTAFDGDAWKPCAPGRLLMERTFAAMAERGCRHFDIGVGEGRYKDTFNCSYTPLLDACEPLTPLGRPYAAAWRGLRQLRSILAPACAAASRQAPYVAQPER